MPDPPPDAFPRDDPALARLTFHPGLFPAFLLPIPAGVFELP